MKVDLWKDSKRKTYLTHILVAKTFVANPFNLPEVNHKDEDITNPKADNLEWCTSQYNKNYGDRNKKVADAHCIKIYQYTMDNAFIKEWNSAKEAAIENNFDRSSITKCCKGKQKYHKGYIWSYSDK
ncbi:hypothetical protein GT715_25660 [Clostridium beijerinckii]|nr:HNH endonuclease [Clostridium beijerinckii]MZK53647.1 hypothetical protein [Clostridium beijerinckii]MZK61758.1 hypothetical protein [Clostridium beijerinckii]MZK71957.1 hypothetical protein [Clostridium beijerinckii]MZK77344.1 hypothetical protein [Clostridium beijerinckii]MZK86928.1 hypothetical protein [Clostridium beijerinckii]